jgi:glycosyltransferase involved in cell wall biosynthesis
VGAALTGAEPVRLLLVNPSGVRGGAEESLLEFLTRSDKQRVVTTVACLQDGPYTDDLEQAGVPVVRLRAQRLRYVWMWALTVWRLARLARAHDVVLSWQVKGNYYGTPAARLARRPVAWWDHGIRPAKGEPRYWIDNRLPRAVRADLVVTSSAASAARHHPVRVILPGIPLQPYVSASRDHARALLGLDADEQAIGNVGRLQPWKGQHVLLKAAPAILAAHPRARIVVIGGAVGGFSAAYPRELEELARTLGIHDRVTFLGQRPDVAALLPGLDVFVMASFGEPFGLVTVEAMAAGVPVVATAAGGTLEIVDDGRTGVLVPVDDPAAMAAAIDGMLSDPEHAALMAKAARARALDRFDITRYVRQIEDLVVELASR